MATFELLPAFVAAPELGLTGDKGDGVMINVTLAAFNPGGAYFVSSDEAALNPSLRSSIAGTRSATDFPLRELANSPVITVGSKGAAIPNDTRSRREGRPYQYRRPSVDG